MHDSKNTVPMAEFTHMGIGGIGFVISNETQYRFQKDEPAYEPFLVRESIETPSISIRVCLASKDHLNMNTERHKKIFDSEQSWTISRDRDEYFMTLHPPILERPLWVARIESGFTKVTVYCSEELLGRTNGKGTASNPVRYPLDQILLMYYLAERQGALFHAAGMSIDGKGYIFPGKSGAGKSTITRQFAGRKNVGLLSDDRVVVRRIERAFQAFGTPWPGEEGIAKNTSVPLSGIFFIAHASDNEIREISRQEALEKLLPVASIPWYDREVMPDVLQFCERLISQVPTYELHFRPDVEVVDVLKEFVST